MKGLTIEQQDILHKTLHFSCLEDEYYIEPYCNQSIFRIEKINYNISRAFKSALVDCEKAAKALVKGFAKIQKNMPKLNFQR